MSRELDLTKYNSPVEVVVKDLDCSWDVRRFLRNRDQYGWVRFPNHVTRFSLPLKSVPKEIDMVMLANSSHITRTVPM